MRGSSSKRLKMTQVSPRKLRELYPKKTVALKNILYDMLDPLPMDLIDLIMGYLPYVFEGKPQCSLKAHSRNTAGNEIVCLEVLVGGKSSQYFVSGSGNGEVIVWDALHGQRLQIIIEARHGLIWSGGVVLAALSNLKFASGGTCKDTVIWSRKRNERWGCDVQQLKGNELRGCSALKALPDNRLAVAVDQSSGSRISLWDVNTGEQIKAIDCGSKVVMFAVLPHGGEDFASWDGQTIKYWNRNTLEYERRFCTESKSRTKNAGIELLSHYCFVYCCPNIKIINLLTKKDVSVPNTDKSDFRALTILQDGNIAVASSSTLKIFNPTTREYKSYPLKRIARSLNVLPDGRLVIGECGEKIEIWE